MNSSREAIQFCQELIVLLEVLEGELRFGRFQPIEASKMATMTMTNLRDTRQRCKTAEHKKKRVWWMIVKTSKLEIKGRVEGGQTCTQDATDSLVNATLHSREWKRGNERVVRSCIGMMGVVGCDMPHSLGRFALGSRK